MSGAAESSPETLVGRCYTRARRHPLMIGKWPGGRGRIWGGPYTVPQVVVLAVSLAGLVLTRGVWAHFGLFNYAIALGGPYGLSLLVRHIRVDGRNPLAVAASSASLMTRPSGGRLGGRPLRALGGHRPLIGVCSVTWAAPQPGAGSGSAGRPVIRPARSQAAASRAMGVGRSTTARAVPVSESPVAVAQKDVGVIRGAAGRRPAPVAAALLAARRRDIQFSASDAPVAQRGE
ncbi:MULTISPECIES: hypothetical protein [unclassified Streptomyces]|uniref:hypothetical protein n=1 Tax=unclassified Streptomyces TaxID=2593676 RepID=UPI002F90B3C6|nr:hypothetical protein OG832_43855 [Streptomyces sp. NBC_00826]WTB60740.1 hypothetical protein OG832_48060 [Streptomyces sp. NBC_00826]